MSLRQQLNDSMKEAMKAKDAKRLATVRLVLAALKDRDIAARTANIDDLYAMVGQELAHKTTDEWLELLTKADIPCMRPHTLETLMQDPHLDDVGFFRFLDHPSEGRIRTMREPSTWSETPPPTDGFASGRGRRNAAREWRSRGRHPAASGFPTNPAQRPAPGLRR